MHLLTTEFQSIPHLQDLFLADLPAGIRCKAVLKDVALGRVLVDKLESPSRAFLLEFAENNVYPAGAYTALDLAQAVAILRRDRDVVLALWPSDPLAAQKYPFPEPRPDYIGAAIDLTDRAPDVDLDILSVPPDGCHLQRIDLPLLERINHAYEEQLFGSLDRALAAGIGYCLMEGVEVLSQAFAAPFMGGQFEIGVGTPKQHRRKGYAAVTCALLIRECERLGYQPYWNANAQNTASLNLAIKLGFSTERPFRVYGWKKLA